MNAVDFEYANKRLSDFGYIVCSVNAGNSGEYEIEIGCDITFTEVKNNHTSIHSKTSSSYENVYTATFDVVKYDCATNDVTYLSSLEVRDMIKWLSRHEYHKLRLINEISDESNVNYYGSFNVKQYMFGDNILGLTLTFTSNAPYGFADVLERKLMMLNTSDTVVLHGDSDEYGLIYPKVKIKCFADGDLKVTNKTTGTVLEVKNCKTDETITIDGEHKIIFSDKDSHKETLPNDFNYEYFDILVDEFDVENSYTSTLPCEITVSYLPIRKVGAI